jgi:hypothetical protein
LPFSSLLESSSLSFLSSTGSAVGSLEAPRLLENSATSAYNIYDTTIGVSSTLESKRSSVARPLDLDHVPTQMYVEGGLGLEHPHDPSWFHAWTSASRAAETGQTDPKVGIEATIQRDSQTRRTTRATWNPLTIPRHTSSSHHNSICVRHVSSTRFFQDILILYIRQKGVRNQSCPSRS